MERRVVIGVEYEIIILLFFQIMERCSTCLNSDMRKIIDREWLNTGERGLSIVSAS